MYDTILQYKDRIELSNSWISIYQKVYKWVEDGSISDEEFKSLEYKPTREYRMFLHNIEQSFDDEYDFRLIVDKWQLDYIINLLQIHKDLKYNKVRDWFVKLSDEVHSFYATCIGPFGKHLAYHGTRTTELMKQYHVFNKEDPFK